MVGEFIDAVTSFIETHPQWIGYAVFAAAALESIALVGSLVPGMVIVIALAGIAAPLGANIWVLVLWCALGAIIGDGLSFWIGHRYEDRLRSMWPFRTKPELLDKGTAFFHRHGRMSIVVGRFFPVTRAIVPVAAGMLDMTPIRFYATNIVTALAWSAITVVPAAGVGLSFASAEGSSTRIALIAGASAAVFLVVFAARRMRARPS
jgi:undecaprenyl-diphosphatase